ncbi:hypothetical protein Zmor_000988 [Zophobas morio]|uniref:Uncharacterized protein n=1 Tax=Zophobas morio TaxID=2755281 RepID=A0AA38MNY3_9CUCU|nr:hypothetical protein Zmor_000988 [Zophobas morio]
MKKSFVLICVTLLVFLLATAFAYPASRDSLDDLAVAADDFVFEPLFSLRRHTNEKRRVFNFRPDYEYYRDDSDDFPTVT